MAPHIRAREVVQVLEDVVAQQGKPAAIRVDNGPEFISRDLDLWAYWNKVKLNFSRPGMPTDNAFIESFNGKLRAECLNEHWFLSLEVASEKLQAWRKHHNEERPHSSLENILLGKVHAAAWAAAKATFYNSNNSAPSPRTHAAVT